MVRVWMHGRIRRPFIFLILVLVCAVAPLSSVAAAVPVTAEGIFLSTNVERYRAGLPMLTQNDALAEVARRKLVDMFARQYFAHESPSGESAGDLAKAVGYEYLTVGENLALGGFATSREVVNAWMNSPGHRANILKQNYTELGVAAARGKYEGREVWIAVQEFGLPRSTCPAPSASLAARIDEGERILKLLKSVVEMRRASYEASRAGSADARAKYTAYTQAVALYNTRVATYRPLVREYNATVERTNRCIKKYVGE